MDGVDLSLACLRAPHSFGPQELPAAGGTGNSRPMERGPVQVLASDEAQREMKKYSFPVIVIVIVIVFSFVQISSAIVQFKTKSFSFSVIDAPAPFAVPVNRSGICGALYVANPPDACSSIRNNLPTLGNADHVHFALIVRGNCTFEEKVRNTQAAGFRAAIVYDDQDNHNLMSMIGKPQGIQVHAVFVSRRAGEILKMYAQGKDGECCISPLLEGTAWTVLVISMFSLVIIVSVLAILILSRNNRLQRQRSDHYSPTINAEIVRNLPCVTFHTACQNGNLMAESCAICLEVYRDGETLRVLPCQHEYHAVCVDGWLTKWGTYCPVCKHDVRGVTTAGNPACGPPSHPACRPALHPACGPPSLL